MRIGIDIKTLKNRPSGIQVYLTSLLDALQTLDKVNEYVLYEQRPSTYTLFNPRWTRTVLPSKLPGTLWLQCLPPRIKKDRIDIFWGPEQVCPLWKMSPVKYITTIHDFTFMHFPETVRLSTQLILKLTWSRVATVSDALIPVSSKMHAETVGHLSKRTRPTRQIEVITNGAPAWTVPADYFAANRARHLLIVGNIEPRKNIVRLIDALELLHARGITVPLKIISSGTWHAGDVTQRLATSTVKNAIELCGYLPTEALKKELLTCKALVFPSVYEGFGIPVLEALSLDCLVLTSRGTAMEDVAGTCALYFDPLSPESIAACIESIYQPEFTREQYLKDRLSVLSRYTWNNSGDKLRTLFDTLVNNNSTSQKL